MAWFYGAMSYGDIDELGGVEIGPVLAFLVFAVCLAPFA